MAGQSNMLGKGDISDLNKIIFDKITFFDFALAYNLENPPNNFGPEVGLSNVLKEKFPNEHFLLIKYAIGGSSLLDWAPNYRQKEAELTGNEKFGNMYQFFLDKVFSILEKVEYDISGILWMQGERDARIPKAGKKYFKHFKRLIKAFRKDFKRPDLPVIYAKVNPPAQSYPALPEVVRAQKKIAAKVPNTWLIKTAGLEKNDDCLHYSSKGQIGLGERFGEELVKVLKRKEDFKK